MNILCFGDSNTFGISPVDGKRLAETERWPSILAKLLGSEHQVIEAGQPNRTLVKDPPFSGDKSGIKYLKPYLEAHTVDVIIIQLGTNDLKARFGLTPEQIAEGLKQLLFDINEFYKSSHSPTCIIISPPKVIEVNQYEHMYAGAALKSQQLATHFSDVAKAKQCRFLDAYPLASPCFSEGLHLTSKAHNLLAEHLASLLLNDKA